MYISKNTIVYTCIGFLRKKKRMAVVKMLALDIKVNDCKFKQNVNK